MVVVTGLSGAGRSVAAGALQDVGWFVIDNLPVDLVPSIGELVAADTPGYDRVALVMGGPGRAVADHVEALSKQVGAVPLVFLEASSEVLIQRFGLTRRRHPMSQEGTLVETIEAEQQAMEAARASADVVIDTSRLNPHQLRQRIVDLFTDEERATDRMQVAVESFGFKYGVPRDADLVFDCRFLPNPHWVEDLHPLSGLDEPVADYVLDRDLATRFLADLGAMLDDLLPAYQAEGKTYLTIAFGCTGGRHRSVAVAERTAASLTERGLHPRIHHRDINR
ncbi:MAG: RNase adapter RapZ [Acidimicrobiales bacterium]